MRFNWAWLMLGAYTLSIIGLALIVYLLFVIAV
ncbi:hypothetical protein FHR85_002278 [Alkalibacillus almallahensis]|nr:hypothetical protein [Alkalibacillus almallahensis]